MLGDKLREMFDKLSGKSFITQSVLDEIAKDVQKALIVSDVNIKLVLEVSNKIKGLKGEKVIEGMNEKEFITKRIYDILSELFGTSYDYEYKPKKILLLGLFGSGKTTTAVKLASYYKKKGNNVGIIAADTYRMAAYEQLKQYGQDFDVFGNISKDPSEIVSKGLKEFESKNLIIVDSAGRSSLDNDLSSELKGIYDSLKPDLSILVLSADLGQIALTQAQEFNKILPINGIIITKMDGSSKGGGALAALSSIKVPVMFIGVGEKINDLQHFDITRYLSSIMGYGDLQGLLEKFEDLNDVDINIDKFDMNTLKKQLSMTKRIGSLGKIASMLGFGKMLNKEAEQKAQVMTDKFGYIIDSMTKYERENPDVIDGSRIKRISLGSGTASEDVRALIKQYKTTKEAFGMFKDKSPESVKEEDLQGIFKKQIEKKMKKKVKIR